MLLKAKDLERCNTGSIQICPAEMALFDSQVLTCMSSLYFQMSGNSNLCRRDVLLHYNTPTLQRHGPTWFYYFPNEQQVIIRCPNGTEWTTYHETLHDGGLIHGAETCSIASREVRTLPELGRNQLTRLDTLTIHIPELSTVLVDQETPRIEEAFPTATKEIDAIKTRLATQPRELDMNTLLHVQRTSIQRDEHQHWYHIVTLSFCSITILLIISYLICSRCRSTFPCNFERKPQESNPVPQVSKLESTATDVERGQLCENVSFTTYAHQQTS